MLGNLLEDLTTSGFTNLTKSEEPPRVPAQTDETKIGILTDNALEH